MPGVTNGNRQPELLDSMFQVPLKTSMPGVCWLASPSVISADKISAKSLFLLYHELLWNSVEKKQSLKSSRATDLLPLVHHRVSCDRLLGPVKGLVLH